MKKYSLFITTIVFIMCATACKRNVLHGEGATGTTTPSVASFSAIEVALPLKTNITVQAGTQPGIQLIGYNNVIQHIKTTVKGNTLYITSDLGGIWEIDCDGITAQVTVPSLASLGLSGAADADIHGNLAGGNFKLGISGASKVVIDNINADNLSADASGAADIEIKGGSVKKASYEISGAGKILAFPLQTGETSASISGAGKTEVTASTTLHASISGAGTIRYKGHPAVSQEVSGAGSIADAN